MKRVRFYTSEMGQVGFTRWFEGEEKWPDLDWSKVTSIETSEDMTIDQFKSKYPLIRFPGQAPQSPAAGQPSLTGHQEPNE